MQSANACNRVQYYSNTLSLFVMGVKQFLSNLLLNQGVRRKGKTTAGLCHNQEAVIVMIIEAPDVFCQMTNDGWEDLKEDDPSLSLSDLTTGPSWLKLHSTPQLQKLVVSALCTVRYMFTVFFRSKIYPPNIFGRLTCCLNFYPSLSLWEDWKSPPNMIEQLLTERREVGCLLASGAECLHLPLPSPARHLSPIPTIHLSFILLKPSPPYKTNTPPPSV